jgi:hypothetical protein
VEIYFKDLRNWLFAFSKEDQFNEFNLELTNYSSLNHEDDTDNGMASLESNCAAFEYVLPFDKAEEGWAVYDTRQELQRMLDAVDPDQRNQWRISDINFSYNVLF